MNFHCLKTNYIYISYLGKISLCIVQYIQIHEERMQELHATNLFYKVSKNKCVVEITPITRRQYYRAKKIFNCDTNYYQVDSNKLVNL